MNIEIPDKCLATSRKRISILELYQAGNIDSLKARYRSELLKTMANFLLQESVREAFTATGDLDLVLELVVMSPDQFREVVKKEAAKLNQALRQRSINRDDPW